MRRDQLIRSVHGLRVLHRVHGVVMAFRRFVQQMLRGSIPPLPGNCNCVTDCGVEIVLLHVLVKATLFEQVADRD